MLQLINQARAEAGASAVVLGDNNAAQLHAESSLENCSSSHWGIDGLKPYMRYSLAGGYQSNGENGSGLDYCITSSDRYRALSSMETEIRETMQGWMGSPGHQRNILDKWHKKVNIGLAWDRYNIIAIQHFEGDYVEYEQLPEINSGVLSLSARVKNGARFDQDNYFDLSIYFDPPPNVLSRGQLARTYCYDSGLPSAYVRKPLTGGWYYPEDQYDTTYDPCPNPYNVPAGAPAAASPDQAHQYWRQAYDASQSRVETTVWLPAVTASEWKVSGDRFSIAADLSEVLNAHGAGVYTVIVWGNLGGENEVISEYSIFHNVEPPNIYNP